MLDRLLLMAAQVPGSMQDLPQREASKLFGLNARDLVLLFCLVAAIGLVFFVWAYFAYRQNRQHLARSPRMSGERDETPRREPPGRGRGRKRRRERPGELRRNPTLGETGGLPPIRPDEPAQPTA